MSNALSSKKLTSRAFQVMIRRSMRRFLSILFLFIVLFSFAPKASFAQIEMGSVEVSTDAASTLTDNSTSSVSSNVDYVLPYPGILPDNPLYVLKTVRDKIVGFLINDTQKKAEFNLLTSDKRINAAYFLAEKNRDELAVSTVSKSNNYLSLAIESAGSAQASGRNVDAVLHNIKNSINKHKQLVSIIKKQVNSKYSGQLQTEEKKLSKLSDSVDNLVQK